MRQSTCPSPPSTRAVAGAKRRTVATWGFQETHCSVFGGSERFMPAAALDPRCCGSEATRGVEGPVPGVLLHELQQLPEVHVPPPPSTRAVAGAKRRAAQAGRHFCVMVLTSHPQDQVECLLASTRVIPLTGDRSTPLFEPAPRVPRLAPLPFRPGCPAPSRTARVAGSGLGGLPRAFAGAGEAPAGGGFGAPGRAHGLRACRSRAGIRSPGGASLRGVAVRRVSLRPSLAGGR